MSRFFQLLTIAGIIFHVAVFAQEHEDMVAASQAEVDHALVLDFPVVDVPINAGEAFVRS